MEPMSSYSIFTNSGPPPDFTWTVEGIKALWNSPEPSIKESERTFAWPAHPQVEARPKLSISMGMVYMSLNLRSRPHLGPALVRPVPSVWYVLRDRTPDSDHPQHVVRAHHSHFGHTFGHRMTFERQLFSKAWLESPLYNVDDSVVLEVYVQPLVTAAQAQNLEGFLSWTVDGWARKKEALLNRWIDTLESPYIYTDDSGYRLQAWMCASDDQTQGTGEAKGGSVEAQLVYSSGEFDNGCPTNYFHQVWCTVMSVDRSRMSETEERTIKTDRNHKVVIKGDELDDYLEDDTFIIQFIVK